MFLPQSSLAIRLLLALTCLTFGCATSATLQSSRTLGRGGWHLMASQAVDGAFGRAGSTAYPTTDGRVSLGISDKVDLGLYGGGRGVGPSAKVRLYAHPGEGLAIALAPSLAGAWSQAGGIESGYLALDLPLVVGWSWRSGHEAVVAPKIVAAALLADDWRAGGLRAAFAPGLTAGIRLHLWRWFALFPEAGIEAVLGSNREPYGVGGGNLGAPATSGIYSFAVALEMTL